MSPSPLDNLRLRRAYDLISDKLGKVEEELLLHFRSPIPTIDRVAVDAQMKANGVFAEFDHPQLGSVPTVNNPININGITKEKPKLAPEVGQHSVEILRAIGYDETVIDELMRNGVIASIAES